MKGRRRRWPGNGGEEVTKGSGAIDPTSGALSGPYGGMLVSPDQEFLEAYTEPFMVQLTR